MQTIIIIIFGIINIILYLMLLIKNRKMKDMRTVLELLLLEPKKVKIVRKSDNEDRSSRDRV